MKPDEGGGQVFTVSRDFKADNADALTVHTGEKLVLVKAEGGGDPSKWLMQSIDNPKRKGWVPIVVLTPKDDVPESVQQVIYKREAVISELVETEEEYCRDIMQVVDYYMKPLDGAGIPRHVCDSKDKVFGNYKDIAVFHNTVLLEGIKYYAKEPKQLGRAFLRMERDFDKHVTYCHDEPAAQDFLEQNESIRDYFDDLGSRISDDKNIGEHLKLPVQRINDYQLLLKELVKYSERLEEDTTDLNKALELMLGIPHKADDLKYITNIEGYHGDIHKLGRLLRHNWFKVKGKDGKERERYLFLFKARILICKVRKIAGDNRYVFGLKDIIRLPDVQVKDHKTEPRTFEVGQFTLTTHQDHVKEPWLEEIRQYSKNALTLAEHQADDLRLEAPSKDYPLKGVELILATPGNSSDEEMDKSSRRTSLSQRVQELKTSSVVESSYTMTSSSKTVVMEVSSEGTHIEQSSHFESSSSGPTTVIEKIEARRNASAVEIEDMTSRCNLQSLFTKTIEGCTAEPGGSAAFECDIEAAGNLTWIKDNKAIDDRLHDRITQMSVGSHHRLEILNVAESDAGVYTAIANTSSGKVSTCTANLVVEKLTEEEKKARDEANAPLFVVRLKDTEIMQNTFLRFMVKVKGNPNPTVKFYKDDVEITYKNERIAVNNEKESVGYYEMVIPNVQTADVGVYKCVATNSFGSATSEGRVTVVDEKKVFAGIEPPKRKPSANGAAAKDDSQFQWIKDGKPFDPEERFKVLLQDDEDSLALVFTHVKPEDAGLYTCVASTTSGKISCSAELTVQGNVNLLAREPEAPAINAAHKAVDSNVGSSAMLETKIKGYPKPDIKWFRDGKELIMGDRYKLLYEDEETISLVVKTVTADDDGVYKVVATNAAGSSEDTVTLNIKAPPSFKKKLNDVSVTAGAELKLQIEVQANPKPDVQWFKDGKLITESEHVKLVEEKDTYTLMIEKSTLFDVGSYSVICKNNISQCSEFCKVEIEGAPVFTRNLIRKVETEEGDSLTFLVKVHGNPMPIVKWYFKGQPVVTDNRCKISHDMDTHTLTINSINRKDAGEYSCELQNAHGSVKDTGVVMVKCSPEFSKGLGNLVAQEGDTNVGFSVNVSSFPKGKVRWFINTKEISTTSTEYVFREEENSYSMVIKEVTRESAGTYTCKVENSYGFSDTSAELTVLCKPKFKQELKNVTVNAGDKLTLEIEILGTPAPEIKWFKDGNEITNDMHIKIKRDSQRIENYSLSVDLVKAEDSGEYEVRATNEMGSAISKSTVTVQTIPKITESQMKNSEIFETWEATFQVSATGVPHPEAIWTRNGEVLEPSQKRKMTDDGQTYKLEVLDCQVEDEGEYKVTLKNVLGEDSDKANLSVISAKSFRLPQIQKPLVDQSIAKNETVYMSVVLTADPIPEVEWKHGDKDLSTDKDIILTADSKQIHHGLKECTYTMTIPVSKHFDTGAYTFTASNKSGTVTSNAKLDIVLKPEFEVFKDITIVPFEDATFLAVIRSNPRATLTWRKDGTKISDNDHYTIINDAVNEIYKLKISNVHPEDEGLYTLSAVNEIGEASADARLMVHTEQPSFTKTLEDISVRDYAQLELKIRAEGVPKPEISWAKDGVDLVESEGMQLYTRCEGTVSSTLTIPHFSEEYCGRYKARAQSLSGHADTQCVVKMVQLSPNFSKSLERAVNIEENDPVDLYCKVEASPRANMKWFKDGEELQPSENVNFSFKPDGTVKLRIESATPEDCGAYKLVVENPNGMETAICAVSVTPNSKKPEIVKNPEDLEVTEGTPMILEAKIVGFPLPEVKWYKDGIPVRVSKAINFVNSPGGLIGLSIEQAGVENAGEYTLTVSNKLGEASATAKVSVNLKDRRPEFHGHLVPTTVIEGFPAKLCIKIAGTPLPQLSWSLNGTPLDIDGEHLRVVELPDGMFALMIENTGPLDAGTYAVTASNPAGSVTSSAKLEVAGQARKDLPEEKPAFAYEMRDAHADEGSQLQFSIPFRGNPVPQVHWTRNGLPIKPDHRITLTNDGHKLTLQINPCEMGDIGEYVCKLSNQLGQADTLAKANVRKIFHAPVFSQKLMDMEQVIGLDGKMTCRVSGNPRPKISWFRNGKQIHDDQVKHSIKREGDTCVLYIKECSPDDDGIFTCIAENRDGQDSCQATFKAVDKITSADKGEKPCFLKKIGDQEVVNGITGRLTACVSGYPTPEVEWYRNGDRLYPSDRIKMDQESNGLLRLTVTHIDPAVDIGRYKVRIVNDHGEDECEANFIYDIMGLGQRRPVGEQYKDFEEFKLTGSPLPLADKPIISRMSDRRLTLSWKPSIPIGPREPVSYLVEMCEMPSGAWFIARSGLRSCTCDIRNLEPFRDYKFRVRVENKFGVSEPSPYSQTFRAKLLPDQPKFIPYLTPGIDFRPDTSPYFPKDFDIERPPHDGYSQAPRFLRQEHFTQYGVKGHNCNLFWFVYGYPKPKMNYFFNGEPIEMGGRYDSSYTRNGQATLFINRMLERDVGVYEAVAFNEHGEARQRVHLEIAEYPEFIKRPEEITILARQGGRIEARVIGVPYPDVKWFKDWQPLTHSARLKIQRYDPDHCVLAITDAITKDSGLYSITASNVAGAVSCSVMVHVEEKEEFPFHLYGLGHNIKLKTKNLSDFYDLGDELGRGTQGITYHAVERVSGRNYAAKVMKGKGELKSLMHNELDIMNVLRHHKLIKIHDGFETLDTIILVIELASGGELLDCLTKTPYTNENEIASYIRQLLVGLDYLHEQNIAHVGLTPGDILISHSGGDGIKICDYGLARRIHPGQLRPEAFGMPEYVSPEIVKGEGVDLGTDMWSVGVITHLLLTGISLFKGANDMETLTKVREGFWEFNEEYWRSLSLDARDFITKLLVINVDQRMTVKEALRHPWLKLADYAPADPNSISTENLHNYYNSWKDWYSNASCRTWYRRRPLMGAFTHPSKMIYPPNYIATPTESPEREIKRDTRPKQNLGDAIFSRQPIGYDVGGVSSESHYQCGPDTYLLQLRDVDFPVRLREYMKVAAHRHTIPKVTDEPSHLDWQLPVIRERRRFTDVMDEEIDDERKLRINKYALGDSYTVRRLKHELGTRLDTHVEAEALIEATRQGQAPFMREKPQATAILEGKTAELVCFAVGDPAPLIQWFKNDMMLGDSNRVKILDDEKGRSILKFDPAINSDTGIYKVVARNRIGQTVARARVVLAGVPDAPDSPEITDISDTQALLRWKQPKHDGNDPVTSYMLQSKVVEGGEWKTVSDKIDHEFYLVQRLSPVTGYIFRLAAKNNIGWSDTGITSAEIRTKEEGTAKVQVSRTMKALQAISESGQGFVDDSKLPLDYVQEDNPKPWLNHVPTEKYTLISEIYRGRFSVVVKAIDKSSDQVMVCKLFENSPVEEPKVTAEFEVLRRLKHERIANLIEAYLPPDVNYCAFVLEKLQGADILTYLSNRHEYNEQMVATAISQVLDALQYLHWRGLCHLDLQPDNIVMASVRSVQVKLVDFGCAQKVTKLGTPVKMHGALEFSAPEVICQEPAYPQSDIWSIGVLAYLLLSGVSPFHGENVGETRQNINFVRFRFEHLFKEITQEATRFLMQIFKRTPNKRPSAEECHEHRWLCPNEYMIKKRERAVFLGNRLKPFSELYHQQREQEASSLETLTCLVASQGPLARSNSIAEELNTS